jgi:hypothetical protein
MINLNFLMKRLCLPIVLIALLGILNSCDTMGKIWDPADARKIPANVDERVKKNLEEGKGWTLAGGNNDIKGTSYSFASSNPMWRATLEILDFLPLTNVNYSGGIIITDWYNEGTSSDESIKITVRFLSNEIRSDGLKIIVHKKSCNAQLNCSVKKVKSTLEQELRVAILKKAVLYEAVTEKGKKRRKRNDLKDAK